jgi:hypothetical protein
LVAFGVAMLDTVLQLALGITVAVALLGLR